MLTIFVLLGEVAKAKWKGLRDTFRREHQKIIESKRSGAAGGRKSGSSWSYYDSLCFLTDQMTPRDTSGNVPPSSQVNLENESEVQDDADLSGEHRSTDSGTDIQTPFDNDNEVSSENVAGEKVSSSSKLALRNKRKNENIQDKFLKLEEEKLNFFKQRKTNTEEKDYDLHFLLSLLPHFRKVTPERKLLVQMRLQQVLLEEIMPSQSVYTGRISETLSNTAVPTPSPAMSHSTSYVQSPFSPVSETSISTQYDRSQGFATEVFTTDECNSSVDAASYITNFKI